MIIGITGTNGAGKGTVVDFLKQKGFTHYSVRKYLEALIVQRGMPVDRPSMIAVGNELRAKYGSGYLAEQLLERALQAGGDAVIESIRTVGETEFLKSKGAVLWAVDANPQLRYERIVLRGSGTDHVTFEKFVEQERTESDSADPTKQNLNAVRSLADVVLFNDGTQEELFAQVEKALK